LIKHKSTRKYKCQVKVKKGEAMGRDFPSLHVIQTGFGSHPAYYPMGTGSSFLGIKEPEA
jgi:hypothetical protein